VLEQKATVSIGWEASIIVITLPSPPVLRILSPDALAKKFPPFCGIRRLIIVFATESHRSLSETLYPPSVLNVAEMGRIMLLLILLK
jgi:hypothetical protein